MVELYDDYLEDEGFEEELISEWLDEIDNLPEVELKKVFRELETESSEEDEGDILIDKLNI